MVVLPQVFYPGETMSTDITIYECRGCGRHVMGPCTALPYEWSRIERIDGPNGICPACVHDCLEDVLNRFREDGYEHAHVVLEKS
jgi:hypothetical protein